jgi:hypothetical protein
MQTVTSSIVEVAANTPIADAATQARGNTFVVTRTDSGAYFALTPREAERLGEELPDESFESALVKARWTPSRTHRELRPMMLGTTPVRFTIPHVTLRDNRDRVVVVDEAGTPTSVVHFDRSVALDYVVENCPATKELWSSVFPTAKSKPFIGDLTRVIVIDHNAAMRSDKIGTALADAQSKWSQHRDPKVLHAALLRILALLADEMG